MQRHVHECLEADGRVAAEKAAGPALWACTARIALATVAFGMLELLSPCASAQEAPAAQETSPAHESAALEPLLQIPIEKLLTIKVTTPSLRPQELQEVPVTTYVVTEEDFRAYGYRDLKDILRNLPGIEYIYPNSHLFGGQRGFSSFWDLTKLLINGRESNNLLSNAPFIVNQFSLTGVKRVEIVQGPASVLYGSEAFSGVINIITKDAENSPTGSEVTGIVGGGDKSSLDTSGAFHTVAQRGPLSLALGAYVDGGRGPNFTNFLKTSDYSEVNRDLRTFLLDHGNPYRDNDRNSRWTADLAYSPISGLQVKAGALYWRTQDGGGIEQAVLSYTNDEIINEQTHFHVSGDYRFATVPVKTTLSYQFMLENFWTREQNAQNTGDNPPLLAAFNVEKSKLNVVNLQVDYFPSIIDNYFLAGVGMRDTRVGEPASTGISPTDISPGQPVSLVGRYLYPPTGYFSNLRPFLGQNRLYVYAQDQQSLWRKRIQITAGLRYDHNSIYGGVLNVRGGLLVRPLPNYTIRATLGQGFREPRVVELLANPNLVPARMNTWELSLLFTPVRSLSGQVAYFQNRASKLIVPGLTPFSSENIGKKRVAGVETLIRYHVGPFGGDLWHSYEYPFDDQPLLGAARNKLGFGGHYEYREHLSLALRTKYTSRAHGQALDAAGNTFNLSVPQYFTLDLNALARDLAFAGVNWDVSFSISNILGRSNYYVNTSGPTASRYLAEGREFFGKVTARF
jgi:iron complex outermembrane receptor protein